MKLVDALDVEAKWCILPPWIRACFLLRAAGHDPTFPALARRYVLLAHHCHDRIQTHLSIPSYSLRLPSRPRYFSCVLEAPASPPPRRRVVLLHGWLMTHKDWKQTAWKLHREHGYSVLLVDFIGHGHSPLLDTIDDHGPGILVHQVRDALVRAKWTDAKITIAAPSLGSAIALRYAQLFPAHVYAMFSVCILRDYLCRDKIVMLCGAGMPATRWYAITPTMRRTGGAFFHLLDLVADRYLPSLPHVLENVPWIKAPLSLVWMMRFTPEHQVESGAALHKVLDRCVSTVIWSHLDVLHPLELEHFRDKPPQVIMLPYTDHVILCSLIDFLQLHRDRRLWGDDDDKTNEGKAKVHPVTGSIHADDNGIQLKAC
ncbi:Aste57867_23342 [Aphanomyces stellatus]|uniref:Aste57867_23342 protein n=1 Tax=Aphanomyces stellatus TaxID=120398 RepID=A0A485LN94_9STRA|nr:hypothetical protein As57867_023271 [Aphanomyces stellatus]VFT99987.1 Aste57867_23342 [Aphanomyces stellatus]